MTAYNTSVDIALDGNLYILLAAGQISAGEIQRHSSRYVIGPYDFTCGEWWYASCKSHTYTLFILLLLYFYTDVVIWNIPVVYILYET